MMDTVLFTDHRDQCAGQYGEETRAEIEHRCEGGNAAGTSISDDRGEWNLLKGQFQALVRERSDDIEDIFDMQFRGRFSELIYQSAFGGKADMALASQNVRRCTPLR